MLYYTHLHVYLKIHKRAADLQHSCSHPTGLVSITRQHWRSVEALSIRQADIAATCDNIAVTHPSTPSKHAKCWPSDLHSLTSVKFRLLVNRQLRGSLWPKAARSTATSYIVKLTRLDHVSVVTVPQITYVR